MRLLCAVSSSRSSSSSLSLTAGILQCFCGRVERTVGFAVRHAARKAAPPIPSLLKSAVIGDLGIGDVEHFYVGECVRVLLTRGVAVGLHLSVSYLGTAARAPAATHYITTRTRERARSL